MSRSRALIFVVLAFLAAPANAALFWCAGTVSNMYVTSSKEVVIKGSWRNDYTRICKTDGGAGGDTINLFALVFDYHYSDDK